MSKHNRMVMEEGCQHEFGFVVEVVGRSWLDRTKLVLRLDARKEQTLDSWLRWFSPLSGGERVVGT